MTASFAAGQIAGPLLVRLFPGQSMIGADGIALASAVAALLLVLVLTAMLLWHDNQ
jgi:hypothetical protein